MRLFEAILEANNRAVAGDANASLHPTDFADELPIITLTCIDPRLNRLFPAVMGVPEEQFIWLRNAGNIVSGPLSSTTRSMALACAVKGGKEIAIIGHTDCQVCKTTTMQLLERLKAMGVDRHALPDNITEYFGMFGSERQNVIKACDIIRHSPLIGSKVPVQGLLVDIQTGKLDWIVNGYENWRTLGDKVADAAKSAGQTLDALKSLTDFNIGEIKFPETKIGETVTKAEDWLSRKIEDVGAMAEKVASPSSAPGPAPTPLNVADKVTEFAERHWPPKIPVPPPIRPRIVRR